MRTTAPQKQERVHDIFRERRPALETMLAPKSVAVIGATEAEGSVGRTLMENLKAGNFGGEIIPVNLKRARVLGIARFSESRRGAKSRRPRGHCYAGRDRSWHHRRMR